MYTVLAQVTTTSSGNVPAEVVGGSIIGTLVWLAITVALLVGIWKLFAKAGRPGWASLIPIYNLVTWLQITGRSGWWVLGMMVPFLNFFVLIRLVFDLARVYGRGVGFGFGLLFLFPVFVLILAFGDSKYVGPNGAGSSVTPAGGLSPIPLAP